VSRFAATAGLMAEVEERRREELRNRLRRFVPIGGDERVLDAGTGAGAVAFALAPHVAEVVAVDEDPALLAETRRRAAEFPNVTVVEGDITRLPPEVGGFDLAAAARVLHHVARPELAVAELTRVTRPGGHLLVIDQLASVDPLVALELNRFEEARDPTHTRTLADVDLRSLFEANNLIVRRAEVTRERRELEAYLDLAGCDGPERERARGLAPAGPVFTVEIGWYLLMKPSISAR
jgi:ubiquinone/menaquinone biosynthesis C-methylase UbiE